MLDRLNPFLINERISFLELIFIYTIRDFFLGLFSFVPASIGVALRALVYKVFLKSCGRGFTTRLMVTITFPERIRVGNHVGIAEYTLLLAGSGGIVLGNFVRIGPHCAIIAMNHVYSNESVPIKLQGTVSRGIVIEDDCWLGAGVSVVDGVTIGRGSVIGAGSVVTEDIPAYSVAVGVPAKVIKQRA